MQVGAIGDAGRLMLHNASGDNGPATDPVALFCLPHAGGSALAYRRWDTRTPSHVLVRPVELPGRGTRMREPLVGEFDRLVTVLAEEISAQIDGRYALFGHSFGALLAFELARTLRHHVGEPVALLVSGRNGPSVPAPEPLLHALPEDRFLRGLSVFGGTDERLLADPDLRAFFLPIIRADLRLTETYRRAWAQPLRCPISVYAGRCDPLVTPSGLAAWRQETTGAVHIQQFDGGHFYLAEGTFPARLFVSGVLSSG